MSTPGQASAALAAIKQADARRAAARAAADAAHTAETREAEATLAALRKRYAEVAHELAIEAGEAPVNKSGYPYHYSTSEVVEAGIELRWFENDGPDWYYTATWEQLLAATSQET